jgi:hypothetical protein
VRIAVFKVLLERLISDIKKKVNSPNLKICPVLSVEVLPEETNAHQANCSLDD